MRYASTGHRLAPTSVPSTIRYASTGHRLAPTSVPCTIRYASTGHHLVGIDVLKEARGYARYYALVASFALSVPGNP
eukprot:516999-Rhodomonas_salina.3